MLKVQARQGACLALCASAVLSFLAPTAQAQIIDDDYSPPEESHNVEFDLTLFSETAYFTNVNAASNLPGGLEEDAQSGVVMANGFAVSASAKVAPDVTSFAVLSGSHINNFENSDLNFIGVVAVAGLEFRPSDHAALYGYATCVSELDEAGFNRFYEWCGPVAGFSLRTAPRNRTHLEVGARGTLALGDRWRLANYKELTGYVRLSTAGPVRLVIEPNGFVRQYNMPEGLPAPFDEARIDYQGGVEVSLGYSARKFEFGLSVEPSVRWSNYAQYRFWNLRVGPKFLARF